MTRLHAGWRAAIVLVACLAGLAAPVAQHKDIKPGGLFLVLAWRPHIQ